MNTTATTEIIPAERVRPGIAIQRVNIWEGDRYVRQITYRGTERQARAYGLLQILHETDPGHAVALAALRGEG